MRIEARPFGLETCPDLVEALVVVQTHTSFYVQLRQFLTENF